MDMLPIITVFCHILVFSAAGQRNKNQNKKIKKISVINDGYFFVEFLLLDYFDLIVSTNLGVIFGGRAGGVLSKVCRLTSNKPKRGAKPIAHSKLSISDQ